MKGHIRQFIVGASLVPAIAALSGCDKSMELQDIFQCVAAIDENAGLGAVPPSGLKSIPERQCYGLQWSIPLAFEPYLFGTPVENLNITMGLLDQTPGAHMTEVRKAREQPQISVYPQLGKEFQERVMAVKTAAEESFGLKSTGMQMYGMEVYESDLTNLGTRMLMFYPVNAGTSMVVCNVAAGQVADQIDPLTLCTVTSYMDGRLFAEYRILYSLMPQFELINSVLVNHILDFRVP